MNRLKVVLAAGALAALVAFVTREIAPKVVTRTESVTEFVQRVDTLWLEKVIVKRIPARRETVFVNVNAPTGVGDTAIYAAADTVLQPFNDSLSVKYWFNYDAFSFGFSPGPRPIIYQDRLITNEVIREVETGGGVGRYLEIAAGFLAGYGLGSLLH